MAKGGIFMFNHRPLFQASSCSEANYHFHIKAQMVESHTYARSIYPSIGTLYLHTPHLESINGMYRD